MHTDRARLRLEELRRRAVAAIPCWPDDAATRAELGELTLPAALIAYVNYADRIIPARPRQVHYAADFWDVRALAHQGAVSAIDSKIRTGEDLTPHLSELVRTHGFVLPKTNAAGSTRARGPAWDDKDFALNAYETHHLHLGSKLRSDGLVERTDDLVYVGFSRDAAVMVMVGDHESFDDDTLLINANLNTSGHRTLGVLHAQKVLRMLKHIDPQLDDPSFAKSLWG